MPAPRAIDPFEYLDFRALLRDFYARKKAEGRGFSFRSFSRRVGVAAPNHLKRVIDGQRDLTAAMAIKYADACGLSGDGAAYFCELVAFNQAKTDAEKNTRYERLCGFRQYKKARQLDVAQGEYHARWYLPAIRELALLEDFHDEPSWIASQLTPTIRAAEAAHALETLLALGLLVRDAETGRITQGEPVVTTGPETRGLHVANYHRAMIERASFAIDGVAAAERDISSLTMCLPEEALDELKRRIQAFRRELVTYASAFTQGERVVQLNLQLFPLSKKRDPETR